MAHDTLMSTVVYVLLDTLVACHYNPFDDLTVIVCLSHSIYYDLHCPRQHALHYCLSISCPQHYLGTDPYCHWHLLGREGIKIPFTYTYPKKISSSTLTFFEALFHGSLPTSSKPESQKWHPQESNPPSFDL